MPNDFIHTRLPSRVLLVEDHSVQRVAMANTLKSLGVETVLEAQNGLEALQHLRIGGGQSDHL